MNKFEIQTDKVYVCFGFWIHKSKEMTDDAPKDVCNGGVKVIQYVDL